MMTTQNIPTNGLQDVTPSMGVGNFIPGFTLSSTFTLISDGEPDGIYFDSTADEATSTKDATLTVAADNVNLRIFDLTGLNFPEFSGSEPTVNGSFLYTVTGYKLNGSQVTTTFHNLKDSLGYDILPNYSQFTSITKFDVRVQAELYNGQWLFPVSNLTFDSFTIANATAPNAAPIFLGSDSISLNQNSGAVDITALLHVSDTDSGQTLTWSQQSAPGHGTLSISGATASSGGGNITPGGIITYTPMEGFTGTDSFTVQVFDGFSTVTRTITVQVNPARPSAPDLAAGNDSGVSATDNVTNASTLSLSGSGAVGDSSSTVRVFIDKNGNGVYDGGIDATATAVMSNGSWSVGNLSTSGLADGSYNVYAQTTASSGTETSAPSTALSVTLDRTAPTLAITSSKSTIKAGETATITFTFSEDPGATFTWNGSSGDVLVTGGTLSGISGTGLTRTAIFTPAADTDSGTASITVGSGSYADRAGNIGGAGATPSLTFDTKPPAAPSAPDLVNDSDTGSFNTDNRTNDSTPTFSGSGAEAGAIVRLYVGIVEVGSTTADAAGNWNITSSPGPEGTFTFTARVEDALGNLGPASAGLTMTIDRSGPNVSPPNMTTGTDTGFSSSDNLTNLSRPQFTGTASPGTIIQLFIDNAGNGDPTHVSNVHLGNHTVGSGGTWAITPTSDLPEGTWVIKARGQDSVGNFGPVSSGLTVTIDMSAPAAPSTPDLMSASDTGASDTDNGTGDTTPTFTGSAAQPGATVRLYANGTLVGSTTADGSGTWTVAASGLSTGNHMITARSVDLAGNESPDSNAQYITVGAAPVLDANGEGGGTTNTTTHTEDGGAVRIVTGDATLVDEGHLSGVTLALDAAPDGAAEAIAYDAALNGGASLASLGLIGSYDPETGTYTLSGAASATVYQGVLRAMVYGNTSDSPVTTPRTVTIVATDTEGLVGQATATVTVVRANDAPTAANLTSSASFTEDQGTSVALTDIVVTDVDESDVITATLTLDNPAAGSLTTGTFGSATSTYNAGTGVWTVVGSVADVNAALASVGFMPAADWDKPVKITTLIRDDYNTGPAEGTITLNATPTNDRPLLPSRQHATTIAEDSGPPSGQVGYAVSDLLASFSDDGPGRGIAVIDSSTGGTGRWWYSIDDGTTWQHVGTVASSNALLLAEDGGRVYFQPDAGVTGEVPRPLQFKAWDMSEGANGAKLSTTTSAFGINTNFLKVTVEPGNDAPVITVPVSIDAQEDLAVGLTGILVSDVDAGAGIVTITLRAERGSLSAVDGGSVTVAGSGTGTLILAGTVSDLNAYIAGAGIGFQAPADENGTMKVHVTVNDGGNTGVGGALINEAEFDIVVAPRNDAPTSSNGQVTLLEDGSYAFKASDFTFADSTDATAPNVLASIIIDTLPGRGTLTLDGVVVTLGQEIGIADVIGGKLVFTTEANGNGGGFQFSGFTFRVKDNGGTASGGSDTSVPYQMRIDVSPVNDPAVMTGDLTGSVTEDGATTASGTLAVSDIDPGEAGFQSMADLTGTYGSLSFDHLTGGWTYVLNNSSTVVQALREGEVKQDSFKVRSTDGTERTVTITVTGTRDADMIDGVDVIRMVTDNGDGTASQVVTIPVVPGGRQETDGSASYADIPLVTVGGRNLLTVQLGIGVGLTASGFTAPKAAGSSLADLIREITAHTAVSSADHASLTSGGAGFLAGLPADRPLLVQTIVATQGGTTSGVPLVISGSKDADAPAPALAIDARGLSAGTVIELHDVAFATIVGNVRMTGGSGSQVVYGDGSSQHIVLGADDDTIHGGAGDDYVGSEGGNDWLYGDEGDDTVSGGVGNDRLDGGTGLDVLIGGVGNDTYIVDMASDRVIERRNEGTDTVRSSVSYVLDNAHVENLVLTGNATSGYGNSLANKMYASDSGSLLYGWGGNDTLSGGASRDRLYGSSGDDRLYGKGGNDHLNSGSGKDRLDGGAGRDYLVGESGNDTILGGEGNDTISAGRGDDVIYGGLGADVLEDSYGRDTFVFNTRLGTGQVDTIKHFDVGPDTIRLENAIFKKVGAKGWLKEDAFHIGAKAADKDDRIIYDAKKGVLYYDADGTGDAAQIAFAKLSKNLKITEKDFFIV
jgi:VCBS repeat-containing protein